MIKLDISEAIALMCFMGDAILAKENEGGSDPQSLLGDKVLFNGIAKQANLELPADEQYSLYPEE